MTLTVVGCSGSFPGPDSPCSAYLIRADGFTLLLDFGSGSLGALQKYVDPYGIDAIVLTHMHADHFMDACPYVVMRRYSPDAPYPPVPLYGPAGVEERVSAAYGGLGEHGCSRLSDVYDFRTLTPGSFELGPLTMTVDHVAHPVETFGVRLEHGGRSLVYSSDTGPCEAVERLADHCDVFLCEASYLEDRENPSGVHLTGRQAGEAATKAGARRLLLTHLVRAWGSEPQTLAEATAAYTGRIDVVHSGDVFEI
ncbi:MBL fold metallo-hydrolase [Stackebrandtia soli]|uniref:MBL fold metallo-hydrolase n=1 Tax=Stackebrandtia soli TaxID=1892856 RepID=UPI0039EB6D7B